LPPPAAAQGFQLAMDVVSPPHGETWKCQIGRLPGDGAQAVGRVEHKQASAVHHMDVSVLMTTRAAQLEPGVYDCAQLYREYPDLMEQPILYASQVAETKIQLPPGVAASLPPNLTVMYELHHVNAGDREVKLWSRVNAYTMDFADVKQTIWGGVMRDTKLDIPPRSEHTEWTRCVFDEDVDVLFLSTHTHQLGRRATLRFFDGERAGSVVLENDDWANPILKPFTDAPLHVKKGQGFELTCAFKNDGETSVHWGLTAADEMCQFAYVFVPGKPSITCRPVAASDDARD
jgi:hypothetical protein